MWPLCVHAFLHIAKHGRSGLRPATVIEIYQLQNSLSISSENLIHSDVLVAELCACYVHRPAGDTEGYESPKSSPGNNAS